MAVTRSRAVERKTAAPRAAFPWRKQELIWMLAASALLFIGFILVYQSRQPALSATPAPLNLNALNAREDLLPVLTPVFPDTSLRTFAAEKIYYASGSLTNVGALARLRIKADELSARSLAPLRERLQGRASEPLVTADQFRQLKPLLSVRTPARFRSSFLLWCALFFAAFFAAHVFLSLRGFAADESLLPATFVLCGIGLILMVSLRDPLRDNLLFADFAQGAVIGCVLLAALATLDFYALFGKLSFVPLIASFLLSVLLVLFGSGPGASDAKVNLLGF
ncbi:MAG TPA: hypothetical protein VHW24_16375, partial [Bryobacteraceae bacterium]|nr:hypothetical protein [Bryobacteraceae bacterium]